MKIRKLAEFDLPLRVEWMNNPAVYETMSFPVPITLEGTKKWFEKISENTNRADVVFEGDQNEVIGFGGLTQIDITAQKAELYIFINPNQQGKGLGTVATRLLCEYGFDKLRLNKIYLITDSNNIGAIRAYKRVGFEKEGTLRAEKFKNNKFIDRLYFGLLAEHFKRNADNLLYEPPFLKLDKREIGSQEITIVRDDLYPGIGGGVKARKADYYEAYMHKNGYNAIVTTGGIQSNHNRAVALMAAKNGWPCHLVFHGTQERFLAERGNALCVRASGATAEFVDASQISQTMDATILCLKKEGYKPLYIHGGGHDLPGGIALVEAVKELKRQCEALYYKPDYIFHASGTGSTQAGIAVGLDLVGWHDVKLIGISVARAKERGTKIIEEFANKLAQYYGLEKTYEGEIDFRDDYISGGYEDCTPEMEQFLGGTMKKTGILFDTTYSGKALYGMMDIIDKERITGPVLFWHTGGIMNLQK